MIPLVLVMQECSTVLSRSTSPPAQRAERQESKPLFVIAPIDSKIYTICFGGKRKRIGLRK